MGQNLFLRSHLNYFTCKFPSVLDKSGLKPFGVLALIDIIVSVKSLLTETTISIDAKTPNGLSFRVTRISMRIQFFFGPIVKPSE